MALIGAGLLVTGAIVASINHMPKPKTPEAPKAPYEQKSLCIDPFTSRDMGTQTYTWCRAIPMWSTKA